MAKKKSKPDQSPVPVGIYDEMFMKLQNDLLEEARNRTMNYVTHNAHNIIVMKGKQVRLIIWAYEAPFNLKTYGNVSQDYLLISPKPSFRKLGPSDMHRILEKDHEKSGQHHTPESLQREVRTIYSWAIFGNKNRESDHPGFIEMFVRAFGDHLKTEKVRGFANLYNRLTASYDVFETLFQLMFGTAPAHEDLVKSTGPDVEKIGKAIVQFGDVPVKARVDIRAMLGRTATILEKYGLGDIMNCRVITKKTMSALGTYSHTGDVVELKADAKATKSAVYTLIHEFGHRFYYRADGLSSVASKKYSEIAHIDEKGGRKRTTNETLDDMDDVIEALHNRFRDSSVQYEKNLSAGMGDEARTAREQFLKTHPHLKFQGRTKPKSGFFRDGIVIIIPRSANFKARHVNVWTFDSYRDMDNYLSGKPDAARQWNAYNFFTGDDFYLMADPETQRTLAAIKNLPIFKSPKIPMGFEEFRNAHTIHQRTPEKGYHGGKEIFRKDWHVTNYAQTNVDEWFAELFTYYILGQLSAGEPKAWMKYIIAEYRTKIR